MGSVKWPTAWKQEMGIPLQKVDSPQNEDDLRVISLTPFLEKISCRMADKNYWTSN